MAMVKYLDLQGITAKYADEIHQAVARVTDSGWYLQGEENKRFEQHYAEYIGTRHCIGVANGLDALIWILRAYIEMGFMHPGDEVLVPANTYIASILAITENGLKPVLIEPRLLSYQIDEDLIEQHITERSKALMIVHLYGQCAFSDKIKALCLRYGLKLIEDNAQAHGCVYRGRKTGSLGDAAGHSFYPGKNLGPLGTEVLLLPMTRSWQLLYVRWPITGPKRNTFSGIPAVTAGLTRFRRLYWMLSFAIWIRTLNCANK